MHKPDYLGVRKDILKRIRHKFEREKKLYFHNHIHTKEVLNAAEELAELEGISKGNILLLRTAALYHDAGFLEQYENNELIGARIAEETLPKFGYTKKQIETITHLIEATKIPQEPNTKLEMILCDADLDNLGRPNFFDKNSLLRKEMESYGRKLKDEEWHTLTLNFLENHNYFTQTAIKLWQKKKEENMKKLQEHPEEAGLVLIS